MRDIRNNHRLVVTSILTMSILAFVFGNTACRRKTEREAELKKKYGVHYMAADLGKMTSAQKREIAKHHQEMLSLIDEIREELIAIQIEQKAKSPASESNLLSIEAALRVTKLLRKLECGDLLIRSKDEGNLLVLGREFYEEWNQQMKLYGTKMIKGIPIVGDVTTDTFVGKLTQITEGEWKGAFQDKDGEIIIPGIKYLEQNIR